MSEGVTFSYILEKIKRDEYGDPIGGEKNI